MLLWPHIGWFPLVVLFLLCAAGLQCDLQKVVSSISMPSRWAGLNGVGDLP